MYTGKERIQRFLALSALYFRLTEESAAKTTIDTEIEEIPRALQYYASPMPPDTVDVVNT